jgi:hypothetical protein
MADPGDIGIMMYSTDHYIFNELQDVEIEETGLLVPLVNGEYRVLKLASSIVAGAQVTIVHDNKNNYYAVQ